MAESRIGEEICGPSGECYRIAQYLGRGGFGEVYLAEGLSSARIAAVKFLPLHELDDLDLRTALLNEVELATQVTHPNVVEVLHVDRGTSSKIGPYLVMEYVSGGTLRAFLDTQRKLHNVIPLTRAREMMVDIAQGAKAINAKLIHRDIRPDNILMAAQRLKLSDFGICKMIDEKTRTQTFKGAQHIFYMAPEGWEGAENTFKLDVYSVGLVFYEILTLQHPLARTRLDPSDWRAWQDAHLFAPCPDVRKLREDVDLGLAQLLTRMAEKRPQERPNWQEILRTLDSGDNSTAKPNLVTDAVEAALVRKHETEMARLAGVQAAERKSQKEKLYQYACERLLNLLDSAADDFNSQYQFGAIEVVPGSRGSQTYNLPTGGSIECIFFPPRKTDIKIAGKELMGGGYLGVVNGPGANLLLLRQGDDDLYGQWVACRVDFNALLVDRSNVLDRRGMPQGTVVPFGFEDPDDFYREVRHAAGGMHVFTYKLIADIERVFADILKEAISLD